jgi:hypothetical protein
MSQKLRENVDQANRILDFIVGADESECDRDEELSEFDDLELIQSNQVGPVQEASSREDSRDSSSRKSRE